MAEDTDPFYTSEVAAPVAAPTERRPLTGMEVAKSAYANLGPSAAKAAKELVYPFTHMPETLEGLKTVGSGIASKAAPYVGSKYRSPEGEAALGSIADFYKDRYGSFDSAKRAFAEDPVGVAMDASTALTGVGGALRGAGLGATKAAKLAGQAGRVGQGLGAIGTAVGETGRFIDPVAAAAKAGAMAAEPITRGLTPALFSVQSGKSAEGLRRAEEAGASGNPEFFRHMFGGGSPEEVIKNTQEALQAVKNQRSEEYLNTSAGWKSSQVPLSLDKVNLKFDDILSAHTPSGGSVALYMKGPLSEIRNTIDHYNGTRKTMADLDLLKRDLDRLYYDPNFRSAEAKAALTQVRHEVWNTIANHDPAYADIMGRYEDATNEINNIVADIGTNKASTETRLRKLIKASGSETGKRLAKENPDLPFQIAGQELTTLHPGGIRGAIFGSLPYLAGSSVVGLPALSGIFASSPRVAGIAQSALGAARTAPMHLENKALPQATRRSVVATQRPQFEVSLAAPENPAEEADDYFYNRKGRATGGRISRGMTAQMLIAKVERAKADGQKATEQILDQPDEHVVHALKVANQHI